MFSVIVVDTDAGPGMVTWAGRSAASKVPAFARLTFEATVLGLEAGAGALVERRGDAGPMLPVTVDELSGTAHLPSAFAEQYGLRRAPGDYGWSAWRGRVPLAAIDSATVTVARPDAPAGTGRSFPIPVSAFPSERELAASRPVVPLPPRLLAALPPDAFFS